MAVEFKDISDETYRDYLFPGGELVRIDDPVGLNVSASGGHRVSTATRAYYIPAGWIRLSWEVKPGRELFAF